MLVRIGNAQDGRHAVYKPRAGERPLWDFPQGTLCQREVAAYRLSDFLGWGIVPETLLREGPSGPGSVQRFIDHDPRSHYFTLAEQEQLHPWLARMALFDMLVNNADRKASHVLLGGDERLYGCDHGLTFHPEPKLRTVIWEFGGWPITQWHDDLARLQEAVRPGGVLGDELAGLLNEEEVRMLARRAGVLCRAEHLPEIPEDRRPYPWPLY